MGFLLPTVVCSDLRPFLHLAVRNSSSIGVMSNKRFQPAGAKLFGMQAQEITPFEVLNIELPQIVHRRRSCHSCATKEAGSCTTAAH
jgi:hypothetical protein